MLIFAIFVHFTQRLSLIIQALMHQTTCTKAILHNCIRHAEKEDLHTIPLYYAHIFVSLHAQN